MTTQLRTLVAALAFGAATLPAHAGDADAGAEAFGKQCATCHVVADETGAVLAGKAAKTGPNLYGVIGRVAGSVEGFRYGASLVEAGTAGLVWDETELAAYLANPAKYLQARLDNKRARSQMSFNVRKPEDAANIATFLATFSPAAAEAPATN